MKNNNLIDIYNKLIKKANFKKEAYGKASKYTLQLFLNGLNNAVKSGKLTPAQAAKMADLEKMSNYFKGGSQFGKNINLARFNNLNSKMGDYYNLINSLPAKERKEFLQQISNLKKQYANLKTPASNEVLTPKTPIAQPNVETPNVEAAKQLPAITPPNIPNKNDWKKNLLYATLGGFAGTATVPMVFSRDYTGLTPEQVRNFFVRPGQQDVGSFDPKF